jgi:hypothetical protein
MVICFEEIKTCPNVYPALMELISINKDIYTSFLLLKDENNPYQTEDPLDEFYRENHIYLDNF